MSDLNLKDIVNPEPAKRAAQLNSVSSSTEHNTEMIEAASKEVQRPIMDNIKIIREELKKIFPRWFNLVFKEIPGFAANVLTGTIGLFAKPTVEQVGSVAKMGVAAVAIPPGVAANTLRAGADVVRLGTRPPLIAADKLSVGAGMPSRGVKIASDAAQGSIDKAVNNVTSIGKNTKTRIVRAAGGEDYKMAA